MGLLVQVEREPESGFEIRIKPADPDGRSWHWIVVDRSTNLSIGRSMSPITGRENAIRRAEIWMRHSEHCDVGWETIKRDT